MEMSNSEEENNPYRSNNNSNRKQSSIGVLGARDNEAIIIQGKSDPLTGT